MVFPGVCLLTCATVMGAPARVSPSKVDDDVKIVMCVPASIRSFVYESGADVVSQACQGDTLFQIDSFDEQSFTDNIQKYYEAANK